MQPNIGGGIRQLLFEQMTPGTLKLMEETESLPKEENKSKIIDLFH